MLSTSNSTSKSKSSKSATLIIHKNQKTEYDFSPSTSSVLRIIQAINHHGPTVKTNLATNSNLNYSRLAKHIVWLEKKGLIKSTIEDSRINVDLTEKGRVFASIILD